MFDLYKPHSVSRSVDDETSWIGLEIVRPCTGKKCPLHATCGYKTDMKLCGAETAYLRAVTDSILKSLPEKSVDQLLLNKISLHLLPLYHQLIVLKMEAYSLKNVAYTNNQGSKKIDPTFKEIREIIKAIEATQKAMGLGDEYLKAKAMKGKLKDVGPELTEAPLEGMSEYYETLYSKDKRAIVKELNPKHKADPKWKAEERIKTGEPRRWGKVGRPRNFITLKYKGYICRCTLDKEFNEYSGIIIDKVGKPLKGVDVFGDNEISAEDLFRAEVDKKLQQSNEGEKDGTTNCKSSQKDT